MRVIVGKRTFAMTGVCWWVVPGLLLFDMFRKACRSNDPKDLQSESPGYQFNQSLLYISQLAIESLKKHLKSMKLD